MTDPIHLTFPDGTSRSATAGIAAGDALREWAPDRSRTFLAALVDGVPVDLSRPIARDAHLAPVTFEDRAGREILQHSSAHLVAKALVETVPDARPILGPPTDDGFYYDFDVRPLTPADLDAIRGAIQSAVHAREPYRRREVTREEAERMFEVNPYKLRYIADTPPGETISVYRYRDVRRPMSGAARSGHRMARRGPRARVLRDHLGQGRARPGPCSASGGSDSRPAGP